MNTILFYNPLRQTITQLTEAGNIVMKLKDADEYQKCMTLNEKEKTEGIKKLLFKYADMYPMDAAYRADLIN